MSRDFNLFPDGAFGSDYYRPKCGYCFKKLQVAVQQAFTNTDIRYGVDYYCLPCMKERIDDLSNHSTTTEDKQ